MKIGKEEGILVAKELAGLHHYRLQQSQPSIAVLEQETSPCSALASWWDFPVHYFPLTILVVLCVLSQL